MKSRGCQYVEGEGGKLLPERIPLSSLKYQMLVTMVKSGTKAFTNADVTSSSGLSDATSEADVDLTRLARKRKAGKEPGGDENLEPNQEPVIDKQASVVKRTKLALSGMWSAAASGTVATLRVKNGQKSDADFAGLDNVGNTCFVNSCLYALRFLPGFPGAMHEFQKKIVQLGKKVELESQELKSCAELVLSLHEVFLELRKRETAGKKNPEAVRPLAFVDAFRNCQPSYQKGDQFDAHEFLLLILNSLSVLAKEVHKVERRLRGEAEEAALARRNNGGKDRAGDAGGRTRVRRSSRWNKGRCGSGGGLDVAVVNPWVLAKAELNNAFGFMSLGGWRGAGNKAVRENVVDGNERVKTEAVDACDYQETHMTGTCVVETKCLDCEETTNIVESFTLLSIPVDDEGLTLSEEASDDPSYTPILNRLRVEDLLADENKIFCDICSTRQPAKRSVAYSRLPAILVLHLKRFSTFYNARTSKIESEKSIDFLRTPSVIPCFCQECERGASGSTRSTPVRRASSQQRQNSATQHLPYALQCVVEHQGSMSCGHYVSYSRVTRGKGGRRQESNCCMPLVPAGERVWIKCDDCCITRLTEAEMAAVLDERGPKAITPYLLFYARTQ